jgi:outer membrane receptor protein involved in Fe transport
MFAALLAAAIATPTPTAGASPTPRPAFTEQVTVVSSAFELSVDEAPGSVAALGREDLSLSPSPALDDTLRQVPGFTLFRRSGSRTANPTAQGVSLRAVGASGASRAIVLCDGVPLGDPFGGWVYWSRVPRAAVDRVEILRGGGSSLYGSGALGGVVRLFRRAPEGRAARVEGSMGSQGTPEASAFGSAPLGRWTLDAAGEYFRTDGYVLVAPNERGAVDAKAASRHATGDLGLGRAVGVNGRVFARVSGFDEDRQNGTPLQVNDTQLIQGSGGLEAPLAGGRVSGRAFWEDQDYHQTFSTIAADRASERLNRTQDVAARSAGASAEWTRVLGRRHRLAAGTELRQVKGQNDEVAIAGTVQTPGSTFGRQRIGALFAEDAVELGRHTSLTAGLRLDEWRNDDARRVAADVTTGLASRSESAWSPRAALVHEWRGGFTAMGSAYKAFRAPTLNELYRSFRVGNVATAANESLSAERLSGFDVGLRWSARPRFSLRATAFRMIVDDPIANVTLRSTPALIERQRQNLGSSRSQGLELDAQCRVSGLLRLSAAYLFADAAVRSFSADPTLEGRRLPQVARHSGTVQALVTAKRLRGWLQARGVGEQFDDDQNQLRLAPFAVLDARIEHPVHHGASLFLAAENLLDARYDVGRTPNRTIAPPRSLRVGFSLDVASGR